MAEAMRSSLSITISVWRSLLLREALSRISGGRAPWVWLLLEPVVHMTFMVFIFTVIGHRVMGGIDIVLWIIVGFLAFFVFRRSATQGVNGINANRALFTYRQVRPFDTVFVRAALEGAIMILITLIVLAGAGILGRTVLPDDPLTVFLAFFGLWLLGLGYGLLFSVPTEMIPEFGQLISFVQMPLYLISGVMFPIGMLPHEYREWVLYNPIVHGVELTRVGYANYYHGDPGLSMAYLYACALVLLFFGLALQLRFVQRLIAR